MKQCRKCKQTLEISSFSRRSNSKDGLNSYCILCLKNYQRDWHLRHRNERIEKSSIRYHNNKHTIAEKSKEYYLRNKSKILDRQRKYLQSPEVREKRRNTINAWTRHQLRTNPNFKLRRNMSTRIWHALKGTCKSAKTQELLGCTSSELRLHLEKMFLDGMTWDNYGKWHVDHIIPCDAFDLTKTEEQKKCFHYSNLQPLWASSNQSKSNSVK